MAGLKERLIQFVLRGKDEMSPAARQSTEALDALRAKTEELGQALDAAKDARGLVNSLASTQRAVGITETSLGRAEKTITDLREALNQSPDNKGLEVSLKAAEKDASSLRRTLDTLNAKMAEQELAANAAGVDTNNLAGEEKRLAAEVSSTKEAISQNAKALRDLERDQARAAREAANHVSRVTAVREAMASGVRQAAGYAAAFVGVEAVFGLVGRAIGAVRNGITTMLQTGDQFENLQNRLTSLMGSVAGGEQAAAWIKSFAKETPLELADVTDAFALLKAYGLDPMDGSLKAIEDQSEKLGGGMERLEGISSALGQAWSKQKLQTEEILQLVERGVPVWDMLSKVTGKNAEQLQELASKGKLGRDVIKALIEEMGRSSEGAAAAAMGTLAGLLSNLSDTAADFFNRISNAGALDYVKGKLKQVADTIAQMDADGRLDKLAKALATAFVQGAEKVGEFISRMAEVDFRKLTDDSAAWLSDFGSKLDDASERLRLFMAPFRTLGNVITGGLSQVAASFVAAGAQILSLAEMIGEKLPESFGGKALADKARSGVEVLKGLYEGLSQQAQDDLDDISDAWADSSKKNQATAQQQATVITEHFDTVKTSAKDAATQSVQAVTSLQNALDQISAARTVAQLTQLQEEMRKAYQAGALSQQDYANAAGVLNTKLRELNKSASDAALGVSDLSTGLENLAQVQDAISNARTSVDLQNIRTALNKLYNDGTISAREFNQEQTRLNQKVAELKQAGADGAKGARDLADASAEATRSLEDERRAIGEAMEAHRKGTDDAEQDMQAFAGFFGGVMSTARQGVAQLGEAALEAFDALRGISSVDLAIDTSSLDATTDSLQRVRDALVQVSAEASKVGLSSLGRWAIETQQASLKIQVATLQQKQALQSLMDGYENGRIELGEFVARAQQARNGMNLLNDSDLRTLESAIQSAKQEMQQLQEGSRSTLASLQEQLASLRGDVEAASRSKFQSQRADLQAQLAKAQASGDNNSIQNFMAALATLTQLERETEQKQQREAQQKLVDAQAAGRPATAPAAPSAPTKVIRLETPRGGVDVALQNDNDETKLLGVLEAAGMRTI